MRQRGDSLSEDCDHGLELSLSILKITLLFLNELNCLLIEGASGSVESEWGFRFGERLLELFDVFEELARLNFLEFPAVLLQQRQQCAAQLSEGDSPVV
jgi:hypothetical protein